MHCYILPRIVLFYEPTMPHTAKTHPPEHVYNSNLDHLQGVGFLWSFASFPSHKDFLFMTQRATALFHTLFSLSSNERLNWGGMFWNGAVVPSVQNSSSSITPFYFL